MSTTRANISLMGFDFELEIEIQVRSFGTAPSGQFNGPPENYDPGSEPDFDIVTLVLRLDGLGPAFEATGELFYTLSSLRSVDDAILDHIVELEENYDDGWDDIAYSREDYRERDEMRQRAHDACWED